MSSWPGLWVLPEQEHRLSSNPGILKRLWPTIIQRRCPPNLRRLILEDGCDPFLLTEYHSSIFFNGKKCFYVGWVGVTYLESTSTSWPLARGSLVHLATGQSLAFFFLFLWYCCRFVWVVKLGIGISRIPSRIPKPSSPRAQKLHVRRRGLVADLFTMCWGLTPGGPTIG